ncbi:MAG: M48 family metallopeptidase, partial [Nitrososphaera sp.]
YKRHLWQASSPTFDQNSLLPYLGKGYTLHVVIDRYKEKKIRFVNNEFLATLKSSKNQRREVRKLFYAWLEEKAKSILKVKVRKYSRFASAKPRKIIIKDMRNRWGSATNSDVLNFNVKLLKAPEDVIDYVVLHELCHLKVRDHSHHFWGLLRKVMPDYRQKVDWLSTNAQGLVE